MKKRIPSIVMYVMKLLLFFIPWLTVGEEKYNLIQFVMKMFRDGLENLIMTNGLTYGEVDQFKLGITFALVLFFISAIVDVIYIIKTIRGKKSRLNLFNVVLMITLVIFDTSGVSMWIFTYTFSDKLVPYIMMLITWLEFPAKAIAESWEESIAEAKRQERKMLAQQKEEEERLRFDGKYTSLFYHFVWKNFKRNWKDYLLLLFTNIVIFGCTIVGFGMRDILKVENTTRGSQMFNGLNRILVTALIPMAIIAIFIFILLFFHYLKCRAKNFGVFLTLGMRRNMLYRFVAMEYISMLGIAMLIGGFIGTGVLMIFIKNSEKLLGMAVSFSVIGIGTYAKSVCALLLLCLVSVMSARIIFTDFNVGKSTDLRAIAENMPKHFHKIVVIAGSLICGFSVYRYQNLDNFENISLLFVFFIGMFLIMRYGMAGYLIGERRRRMYLKKLMIHNQLFHKSKTSTGYIGAIFMIHFCILFYFMLQMISANISEDVYKLFPYDVVCLADEKDNDIFGEIRENYDVKMIEYPALRVSAYDGTEKKENTRVGEPIQGQHIGISESTYHALKKKVDSDYVAEDLHLDADGEYIHVVYQQDQSEHAKPTAFFTPRSKPLLHIGQPCREVMVHMLHRQNVGYDYYKVRSEEIGSLIGIFHQGEKENIIVFSDEYFEKAKDFWKTTDYRSGEQIENEEERIPGMTIHQGITRLVLFMVADKDMENVAKELEVFEQRHYDEEKELFKWSIKKNGVYDLSVSYYYTKDEMVKNILTERFMKITMNGLAIVVFFVMNLMLVIIKMLSEMEMNLRRTEFLTCMGMRKKERIRLMRTELLRYYYFIPLSLAAVSSVIYIACTIHARMYPAEYIKAYLENMIPVWIAYFVISTVVMWIATTIYAYRMEKN